MIDNDAIFNVGLEEQSAEKFFKDEEPLIIGDMNDFITGKDNLLFVTGLSGSGKSSFTYDFAKKSKDSSVYWAQLDYFDDLESVKTSNYETFKKSFGSLTADFFFKTKYGKDYQDGKITLWYIPYIDHVMNKCDSSKEKLIIDGIHIIKYLLKNENNKLVVDELRMKSVLNHTVVFMRKSVKTSTLQAYKRDKEWTETDEKRKMSLVEKIKEFKRVLIINLEHDQLMKKILKNIDTN